MENVNRDFDQLSQCFIGTLDAGSEIVFPEKLDRSKLDYSIESLKAVDDYLVVLHENHENVLNEQWVNTVLSCGAYVGEVIRRNASCEYNWYDFEDFITEYPYTTQLIGEQKEIGTCSLLSAGSGGFNLPIGKVFKFIINGKEDSVWFHAHSEIHDKQ